MHKPHCSTATNLIYTHCVICLSYCAHAHSDLYLICSLIATPCGDCEHSDKDSDFGSVDKANGGRASVKQLRGAAGKKVTTLSANPGVCGLQA